MSRLPLVFLACQLLPVALPAAAPPPPATNSPSRNWRGIARPSVVVVSIRGRDGKRQGLGTGFVVAADGLIATNLHVIGEGRAITVELADGKNHEVVSVHATDRKQRPRPAPHRRERADPAVPGRRRPTARRPSRRRPGQSAGIEAQRRRRRRVRPAADRAGRSMIQVAIPIEPGNSGGPVARPRRPGRRHHDHQVAGDAPTSASPSAFARCCRSSASPTPCPWPPG